MADGSCLLAASRQGGLFPVEGSFSDRGADDGSDHGRGSEDGYRELALGPDHTSMALQETPLLAPTVAAPAAPDEPDPKRRPGGGRHGDSSNDGSDEEGVAADSEDADFRRGQRQKRLVRMLESDQVRVHIQRFKWLVMAMLFLMAAAGVAIYVVTTQQIKDQLTLVTDLYNVAQGVKKMMRCAVTTLDLTNMYAPWPFVGLQPTLPGMSNNVANLVSLLKTYSTSLATFTVNHHGTYEGFGSHKQLPTKYGLRALWETPSLTEYQYSVVASSEAGLNPATGTSANTTWKSVVQVNTVTLYELGNNMIAAMNDVLANGGTHNATMGANTTWGAWSSVAYIVKNADSTLLNGYLTTLDGYSEMVIDSAHHLNGVQLIFLLGEGVLLAGVCLVYTWYLANKVDKTRYSVYCVFTVVPQALIRSLASQRLNLSEEGESEEEDDMIDVMKSQRSGTTAGAATHLTIDAVDAAGKNVNAGGGKGERMVLALAADKTDTPPAARPKGLLGALMFLLQKKAKGQQTERRRLVRSPRGVIWLCWPFAAWGAAIVLINALAFAKLNNVSSPIMTFNVVNCVNLYYWHALFGVNLLNYSGLNGAPTLTTMARLRLGLVTRLASMQKEYTLLLYGRDAFPLETSPHFRLVTQGMSTVPGYGQQLLYNTTKCLAVTATGCLPVTDVFQPYIMHGMHMMVQRFLEVGNIITQTIGLDPTSAGPELGFMWRTRDSMINVATLLVNGYKVQVADIYTKTGKLQEWALVVTLVLVACYLVIILRPYLREVNSETLRITELLTQLPVEVDVERLIRRALLGGGTVLPPSTKPKDGAAKDTRPDAGPTGVNGADAAPAKGGGVPAWLITRDGSTTSKVPLLSVSSPSRSNKVLPTWESGATELSGVGSRSTTDTLESSLQQRIETSNKSNTGSSGKDRPAPVIRGSMDSARARYGGVEMSPIRRVVPAEDGPMRVPSLSRAPLLMMDEFGSLLQSPRGGSHRRASVSSVPDVIA